MSSLIPQDPNRIESWQTTWTEKFSKAWRIANDGKYYPRRTVVKCKRKDIDDVIATVR